MRAARLSLAAVLAAACGGGTPAPNTDPSEGAGAGSMPSRFANNDTVAYAVKTADGKPIGRAHSLYLDAGDGLPKVRTRIALDPGAAKGSPGSSARSMELVTTLNTDLTPNAYKELHSVDGRLELRFKDREVTVLTDTGVRSVPYKRAGAVLLPAGDLVVLAIALDRAKLASGSVAKLEVLSPKNPNVPDTVSLQVYEDASGRLVAQSSRGKATLGEDGRVARWEDAETGWIWEREEPAGDPPKIEPPADPSKYVRPSSAEWSDRAVVVDVSGGQLSGTLSEPRRRGGELVPGVVFASDLGVQDRHGFGRAIDWGTWQVLDHLVDSGYAVLRVDDRGAGETRSDLPPEEVGLTIQAEDLAACVELMRRQPGIDPDKIFVIGHGTGGVAAILMAEKVEVAGIALVSAPFRPLPEVIAGELIAEGDADKEKVERELRLAVNALEGNAAARAQVGSERLASLAAIKAMYVESSRLDVAKALAKVKSEIAVFQGLKDFQVSWREDAQKYIDALKKPGAKKAKLYAYENVDHLMKSEPAQSSYRRYADKSRRIDPRFLEELGTWLGERVRALAAAQ